MRIRKLTSLSLFIAGIIAVLCSCAVGQELRSEVSIQGTGFFTKDSTDRGLDHSATDTGGVLAGYRYHVNRWLSAEAVYGWDRSSQVFNSAQGSGRVQADVHQATGGLVFNVPVPRKFIVRPYVLAEGGALVFRPTNASGTIPGVEQQAVGAFVYGGGFDYQLPSLKHIALRAEYRGYVYNVPDFGLVGLRSDAIAHTAQPSAGLVYRF